MWVGGGSALLLIDTPPPPVTCNMWVASSPTPQAGHQVIPKGPYGTRGTCHRCPPPPLAAIPGHMWVASSPTPQAGHQVIPKARMA